MTLPCLLGQDGTARQADAKVPQITAELRARFWRAVVEQNIAEEQAKKAKDNLGAIRAELERTFGNSFVAGPNETGEPICLPKPAKRDEIAK
jgi:hypothetical protein